MSAIIRIKGGNNQFIKARVLLDTCSTANFVSEKFANQLSIPMQPSAVSVSGINATDFISGYEINITFRALHNEFEKTLRFLTIPRFAITTPTEVFPRGSVKIPKNIQLADPEFHLPRSVDLLIGAGASLSLFSIGQINLSRDGHDLYLQKTRLGWVVAGSTPGTKQVKEVGCNLIDLNEQIARFWEIEETGSEIPKSKENLECENHFKENTSRDANGRYIVRLAFRKDGRMLGNSFNMALKRFHSLEKRLNANPILKTEYTRVLQEYLDLGHMTRAQENSNEGYYMPHHAVIKESSATTKVRVVFDASAKSNNGTSLNDLLMIGPTIQDKLFTQLIKFRNHKYVLTADIEKMYRQVKLHEDDKKYQQILWRTNDKIETFVLNTVTFGVASSPFLAIRSIHQLADDEREAFPIASHVLKNDLYVDDLLTGAETIEEARTLRDQIIALLAKGGFNIRQWASNNEDALDDLTDKDINSHLLLDKNCTLKTLGISWNAKDDKLMYRVAPIEQKSKVTKRNVLSEIAKIFDPLGLLAPIILHAKLIMQRLWQCKINWDESVPTELHSEWFNFITQLPLITDISIDRKLSIDFPVDVQIHGFSDASKGGYGACLYLRSTDNLGNTICRLICSKGKVSPLKTTTIPRLELCGALLLTRLYKETLPSIKFAASKTVFWSDSMITLCWIKTEPNLLKTFVSNRVAEIQENAKNIEWRHVRTDGNPADSVSRGQLPYAFLKNTQWFEGPAWLSLSEESWPNEPIRDEITDEVKKSACLFANTEENREGGETDWFATFTSFGKLKRIVAWCLRVRSFKRDTPRDHELSVKELDEAESRILKNIQASFFKSEIRDIIQNKKRNRLAALNPFIDNDGILRVGGRLSNSNLSYDQKHPIILPTRHKVTDIIIRDAHLNNYHSGIQTTLYILRKKYWLLDGRNQVRGIIKKCLRCFRFNAATVEYKMGELPEARVNPALAFSNTGIDFCGPFFVKEWDNRRRIRLKVYVCVFVCMTIKAVHLEVVGDLTTEGFLAAFRRFAARRGFPAHVFSDNGTNFIGANNQLRELYVLLNSDGHKNAVNRWMTERKITWHFIPPLAPNFGGLWESTVKIFKHHLKRVVGEEIFTVLQFQTLVTEIEGILNSRPLTALSSDPNDVLALSPFHYLIGQAQVQLPETDWTSTPTNRLSSWQHITKVRQDFWTRWSQEYLNELHQRKKWTKDGVGIRVGTVVLIKNKALPCLQWPLGRVIAVHPGKDGVIRVATIKTAAGEYQRALRLLCPLPFNDELDP